LEHPKFDIPNSRLPILLVWGFEWHVYGNQHKRGIETHEHKGEFKEP